MAARRSVAASIAPQPAARSLERFSDALVRCFSCSILRVLNSLFSRGHFICCIFTSKTAIRTQGVLSSARSWCQNGGVKSDMLDAFGTLCPKRQILGTVTAPCSQRVSEVFFFFSCRPFHASRRSTRIHHTLPPLHPLKRQMLAATTEGRRTSFPQNNGQQFTMASA